MHQFFVCVPQLLSDYCALSFARWRKCNLLSWRTQAAGLYGICAASKHSHPRVNCAQLCVVSRCLVCCMFGIRFCFGGGASSHTTHNNARRTFLFRRPSLIICCQMCDHSTPAQQHDSSIKKKNCLASKPDDEERKNKRRTQNLFPPHTTPHSNNTHHHTQQAQQQQPRKKNSVPRALLTPIHPIYLSLSSPPAPLIYRHHHSCTHYLHTATTATTATTRAIQPSLSLYLINTATAKNSHHLNF